jgi:hypothetical protein
MGKYVLVNRNSKIDLGYHLCFFYGKSNYVSVNNKYKKSKKKSCKKLAPLIVTNEDRHSSSKVSKIHNNIFTD